MFEKESNPEIIPVDVILHQILAPDPNSLLSCKFTSEQLLGILNETSLTWRKQAKIQLRYSLDVMKVSQKIQRSFEEHLIRFPTNKITGQPWTDGKSGLYSILERDISSVLALDENMDSWSKNNVINAYCMVLHLI